MDIEQPNGKGELTNKLHMLYREIYPQSGKINLIALCEAAELAEKLKSASPPYEAIYDIQTYNTIYEISIDYDHWFTRSNFNERRKKKGLVRKRRVKRELACEFGCLLVDQEDIDAIGATADPWEKPTVFSNLGVENLEFHLPFVCFYFMYDMMRRKISVRYWHHHFTSEVASVELMAYVSAMMPICGSIGNWEELLIALFNRFDFIHFYKIFLKKMDWDIVTVEDAKKHLSFIIVISRLARSLTPLMMLGRAFRAAADRYTAIVVPSNPGQFTSYWNEGRAMFKEEYNIDIEELIRNIE